MQIRDVLLKQTEIYIKGLEEAIPKSIDVRQKNQFKYHLNYYLTIKQLLTND